MTFKVGDRVRILRIPGITNEPCGCGTVIGTGHGHIRVRSDTRKLDRTSLHSARSWGWYVSAYQIERLPYQQVGCFPFLNPGKGRV